GFGRRRVHRNGVFVAGKARTVHFRFIVSGEKALRLAGGDDSHRLEVVLKKVSKAAFWSSSFQPSSWAKLRGSVRALRKWTLVANAGAMVAAVIERPKQNRMSVRKSGSGMRSL